MAKLSFSIASAIGNVTVDSPVLTDAQMTRFLDYIWDAYPQLNVDGTAKARTNANLAQAYRDWAGAIWNGTKANVLAADKGKARRAAEAGVAEIDA
jgi:hypothetical protein